MFFFFEDISQYPLIKAAFKTVFAKKIRSDMFCNMEEYIYGRIDKREMLDDLTKIDSPFAQLYRDSYPTPENAFSYFVRFLEIFLKTQTNGLLPSIEAKAVINWIYRAYPTAEIRKDMTAKALSSLSDAFDLGTLAFADSIIYDKKKVELNIISSFSGFNNAIKELATPGKTLYYRGHADCDYLLLPSIMRSENWLECERDIYNETLIECPEDFNHCKTHLDYLVHMQHYGVPTRLLDVTRNPLVALYFACESQPKKSGEFIIFQVNSQDVKYPKSDTASILASLPLFSQSVKDSLQKLAFDTSVTQEYFNKKATRLLHEIKLEKPAFRDEIVKKDVLDCFFVLSEKRNQRIVKQDGAFIICGLFSEHQNPIHNYRYQKGGKKQVYIIKSSAKKQLLKTLDEFCINKAHLFPELPDVAEYIRESYQ